MIGVTNSTNKVQNRTSTSMQLTMSPQLTCCIEEALSNVASIQNLESLVKPCRVFQRKGTSHDFIKQVLIFFWKGQSDESNGIDKTICLDMYCDKQTAAWMVVYIVALSITLLIALLGNAFVGFVILRVRALRRLAAYQLLMSLAVSDFLVSLFVIPYKISKALNNMMFCYSVNVCRIFNTADIVFFTASVTHLFVVSIYRYLSIGRPYRYNRTGSTRRLRAIIVFVWMYSCIWGLLNNINMSNMSFENAFTTKDFTCRTTDTVFPRVLHVVVFFIPCFIMVCVNKAVWSIAVKHGRQIEKQRERQISVATLKSIYSPSPKSSRSKFKTEVKEKINNSNSISNLLTFTKNYKSEFKATKAIMTVFGVFAVCWCPVITITFVHTFKPLYINKAVYVIFCDFLPNLNSCLNPFIYCFFHKEFMVGLKSIWSRMRFVTMQNMSMRKRRRNVTREE